MSKSPETDAIIRDAANKSMPMNELAAKLTIKCGELERQRNEARETLEYIAHAGLSGRHLEDIAREFINKYRPTCKRPMQSHSPACQLADKCQCEEKDMEMSSQDIEYARGDYEYQLMKDREAEDE